MCGLWSKRTIQSESLRSRTFLSPGAFHPQRRTKKWEGVKEALVFFYHYEVPVPN